MHKKLDVFKVKNFEENGLARIITTEDKHYWVNKSGKVVSEPAAHVIVRLDGDKREFALVNNIGEIVIPYGVYNNHNFCLMENHNGTAFVVKKDGSTIGLIDDKGKEIVPFGYYEDIYQTMHISLPKDYQEKYIIPYEIRKNTYVVKKDNKCGLINDKGDEILPCVYEIVVKQDYEILTSIGWGLDKRQYAEQRAWADCASKMLTQFAIKHNTYIQSLTPKKNDYGLCGFVNQQDELIIPYQFRDEPIFTNGFAIVIDYENIILHQGNIIGTYGPRQYHINEAGKRLMYTIEYNENGEIDPNQQSFVQS